MTDWLTAPQVADRLGRAERTVRDQAAAGALKATKVGRDWLFDARDVEAYRRDRLGRPGRRPAPARTPARGSSRKVAADA